LPDSRPIGVFDSGVGGLTVARAILDLLPNESILYVGDSSHFPYGPKPLDEIRGYALEIARALIERDVKMIVVACNSVEVAAIEDVTRAAGVPVIGVIDPAVRAAVHATRRGDIGMIGTQATVNSGAYERALARTGADATLASKACPSFVEYVERGDTMSDELRAEAERYLADLSGVDTLILGCTHYPLLAGLIQMVVGPDVMLVSSAEETAKDVYAALVEGDVQRHDHGPPSHKFLSTGDPEQFRGLAEVFLGPEISRVEAARLGD
jgi:glutamate racemase